MTKRESLQTAHRWVVKIGSALITADGKGLDRDSLRHWVDQMADLIGVPYQQGLALQGCPGHNSRFHCQGDLELFHKGDHLLIVPYSSTIRQYLPLLVQEEHHRAIATQLFRHSPKHRV